jgi:hypothetical protein
LFIYSFKKKRIFPHHLPSVVIYNVKVTEVLVQD